MDAVPRRVEPRCQRHIAAPGKVCSNMAAKAGEAALRSAGADPAEIDLLIVATITDDHGTPSTAVSIPLALEEAVRDGRLDIVDIVAWQCRNDGPSKLCQLNLASLPPSESLATMSTSSIWSASSNEANHTLPEERPLPFASGRRRVVPLFSGIPFDRFQIAIENLVAIENLGCPSANKHGESHSPKEESRR